MGVGTSSSKLRGQNEGRVFRRPEGMVQLNDSVWELYTPQGVPEVEVIFFHGLQLSDDYEEAFWKTWLSRDATVVWPKDWLSARLPKARILSISYSSCAQKLVDQMDIYITAENLISDLIWTHVGQSCPVVLVGHSLGGILIKELLLACNRMRGAVRGQGLEQIENFQRNCRGVFYYSTPHGGSRLADVISRIPVRQNNPVINLFKTLDTHRVRINDSFYKIIRNLEVQTQSIAEGLDTTYKGITVRVVPEASARQDAARYYTAQANHFDVCRPKNNVTDSIFLNLLVFIIDAVGEGKTHTQVLTTDDGCEELL